MKRFGFLILFLLAQMACLAQSERTPVGFYKTPDIGSWSKILIIEPDSTYYFLTDKDRGLDIIEPGDNQHPRWTFDTRTARITLMGIRDYKPGNSEFVIGESANLTDKAGKTWTKFVEFDLQGNVKSYRDDRLFIEYSGRYQPVHSETRNLRDKTTTHRYYFRLNDGELKKFVEEYLLSELLDRNASSYEKLIFIHSQIQDYFPVETEEIISGDKKKVRHYQKDGQLLKER